MSGETTLNPVVLDIFPLVLNSFPIMKESLCFIKHLTMSTVKASIFNVLNCVFPSCT